MEEAGKKKALKRLLILAGTQMILIAFFVWLLDPFYQYHAPFFGMDAVLNDRDNQMPGTIRNFDYDSVLVGSSLAENFDSAFLDGTYGCSTLKIIRASGSVADLLYYLDMAEEERELKNVFWCLDIPAVYAPVEVTLYGKDTPRYLHTKTVLDDLPYLYNKEILMEKIPAMLAYAHEGINTKGQAYNWARDKQFGPARAMLAYDRGNIDSGEMVVQRDFPEEAVLIARNIQLLTEQVSSHPRTRYRFLIPPLSLLWWDCAYVNGEQDMRIYALDQAVSALLSCENAEVYYFQNEESIVCNLDYYMDMVHYSPDISRYMLDQMSAGHNRVDAGNWKETLACLRELAARISREEIYRYYEAAYE